MVEPTQEDFLGALVGGGGDVEEVDSMTRVHGSTVGQVFHRLSDDTFWKTTFQLSEGIGSGIYECRQVQRKKITTYVYED